MKRRTKKETFEKVERIVREALAEKFQDQLTFDPILIVPREDQWGDEYLHVYIVVDGDWDLLDPRWTAGMSLLIRENTTEDELFTGPSKSFVPKSEWGEIADNVYRELARARPDMYDAKRGEENRRGRSS